jgi:hypothetical protein
MRYHGTTVQKLLASYSIQEKEGAARLEAKPHGVSVSAFIRSHALRVAAEGDAAKEAVLLNEVDFSGADNYAL